MPAPPRRARPPFAQAVPRKAQHVQHFLLVSGQLGGMPAVRLHAERREDILRARAQKGTLFDEFVAAHALRRARIVGQREHLAPVGERAVRRDERAALLPRGEHENALREPRKHTVARMEGKLLRPHARRKFAHEQPLFCDLPFQGSVRGRIVHVQPAGKHADEIARGQRPVDGGAVAPFRNARDNGKALRERCGDRFPRRLCPCGQDARADNAELTRAEQFPAPRAEEGKRRIGDGAQFPRIVGIRKRDGIPASPCKAGKKILRLRLGGNMLVFIYTVFSRLYQRRANFFQFGGRKSVCAYACNIGTGTLVLLGACGKPDEEFARPRTALRHSRLSPRR